MNQWKVIFSVNNVRAEQVVTCAGSFEAQKIIKNQYAGQNVQIRYVINAEFYFSIRFFATNDFNVFKIGPLIGKRNIQSLDKKIKHLESVEKVSVFL